MRQPPSPELRTMNLFSSLVWCFCCRTGTISSRPCLISICVPTPIQTPQSLIRKAIFCTPIDLLQMSLQTLLWLICVSEFHWMWLPAQSVAHWKDSVCKQPWKPSSYTWEVCMTVDFNIIHMAHSSRNWRFNFPDDQVIQLTVELISGSENIQTCLSISAPKHLLPMNVYVFFTFSSDFLNVYYQ